MATKKMMAPTRRVEPQHQVTAVFTVDEYAGEGQQQHRRKGLQRDQRRQLYLRMCGLQDVPDHGGGVHAAADHGNEIGCEDQPHPTVLEHLPHISTVNQPRRGITIRYSEAANKAVENAQLAGEWGFMRELCVFNGFVRCFTISDRYTAPRLVYS